MAENNAEVRDTTPGFGWRRLQAGGAVTSLAGVVVVIAIHGFDLFVLIFAVPILVALVIQTLTKKAGVIVLGIVSLALLALNAPFLIPGLSIPQSAADFVPLMLFGMGLLLAVVATVPALRRSGRTDIASGSAKTIAIVAAVILAGGGAITLLATLGVSSEKVKVGDISLVTADFEFVPPELTSSRGTISVHVENKDSTYHTFTIDKLDVDLVIPPGKELRTSFRAGPGTYRFYCRPHVPDMKGTLVVE